MLILGLLIGGLTGAIAGYFLGQSSRLQVSQVVLPSSTPTAQPTQPTQPQSQQPTPSTPSPRRSFPPALNVLGGARVEEVEKDSPAAKAGLHVGDIITAVGASRLDASHSLADLIQAHKPGEKVDLSVTRGAQTLTITVELGAAAQDSKQAWLGIRYSTLPGGRFRLPGG